MQCGLPLPSLSCYVTGKAKGERAVTTKRVCVSVCVCVNLQSILQLSMKGLFWYWAAYMFFFFLSVSSYQSRVWKLVLWLLYFSLFSISSSAIDLSRLRGSMKVNGFLPGFTSSMHFIRNALAGCTLRIQKITEGRTADISLDVAVKQGQLFLLTCTASGALLPKICLERLLKIIVQIILMKGKLEN